MFDKKWITALTVRVEDTTVTEMTDGLRISIRQHYTDGTEATVWSERWEGEMVDYLDPLLAKVVDAYLYREPGVVAKAAIKIHRQAKAHRRGQQG